MKFKFSENTLRFVYTIIAIHFFVIISVFFYRSMFSMRMTTDDCLWEPIVDSNGKYMPGLVISNVILGGVADEAGLKNGDILIAIEGKEINNSVEGMTILNSFKDEIITYTVIRDGSTLDFKIFVYKFLDVLFLIFWTLGLGFLLVGFIVGYSNPDEFSSKLFYWLGMAASTGLVLYGTSTGMQILPDTPLITKIILYYFFSLGIVSIFLFPAMFLHFFLTYPYKYKFKYRKIIIRLLYIIAFAPPVLQVILNIIGNSKKGYLSFDLISVILFPAAYTIIGIITFIISYRKISQPAFKKSLKSIMIGFSIAGIGLTYFLFFRLFINKPIFLINIWLMLPMALELAIPVSFGYSIFKYRILDTEFIVKRGIVLSLVTFLIIGFYLFLVYTIDNFISDFLADSRVFITIGFIIVVTFTFDAVQKGAKDIVDRIFFKERYNYRKSLSQFSKSLPFITDINEMLDKISFEIKSSIGIDYVKIWLIRDDYKKLIKEKEYSDNCEIDNEIIKTILYKLYNENKKPIQISASAFHDFNITEKEQDILKICGVNLSVPLILDNCLIGALNFSTKTSGKSYSDEDIDLLKTFAFHTTFALENSKLEIEEKVNKKLEEELVIAKRIQDGLLPHVNVQVPGYDISGFTLPAKTIGGDFYDIIKISDNKFLLVVADVSGKGIPSAIYMSKVQAMIQFAVTEFENPFKILSEVNKQIFHNIEKKYFVTILAGLLNIDNDMMTICRAGHNPLIYTKDGVVNVLNSKGIGLGLENGEIFDKYTEEKKLAIENEDLFLFYSDGITEAMNSKREEFGEMRLIECVKKNKNLTSNEIRNIILEEINKFREGNIQNDDLTLLIIKKYNYDTKVFSERIF